MENLITDQYLAALREKNRVKPWRGTKGVYATVVAERLLPEDTVLDFGCARQDLARRLKELGKPNKVVGYDPGQPELATWPDGKFDIIVATDVLEHIEPQFLEPTLRRLNAACNREMFFVVATRLAGELLPNGVDHHLIVQPYNWWMERLGFILPVWERETVWQTPKAFACWLKLR
jgi:2-polyprenyl-3-methyl-5-hydroxy-6-metoxy-1,4-benzoquinol methylase